MIGAERIAMAGTLAVLSGVVWLIDPPAAVLVSLVTAAFIVMWIVDEWP